LDQLGLEFSPKLQLDFFSIFVVLLELLSPYYQPLFYFFYFYFEKRWFFRNNPELGYDSYKTLRLNSLNRKESFNTKINVLLLLESVSTKSSSLKPKIKKKCFGPKLNLQNIEELRNYKLNNRRTKVNFQSNFEIASQFLLPFHFNLFSFILTLPLQIWKNYPSIESRKDEIA